MRFRQGKPKTADPEEAAVEQEIRALGHGGNAPMSPADTDPYWQNLLVRTNREIDKASSGKAISISWAARVAIPGVVAILSFLIGLHYYGPLQPVKEPTLSGVMLSMPEPLVDSLLANPSVLDESVSLAEIDESAFDVTSDQIKDYLIANDTPTTLVESMSNAEMDELERVLKTTRD